MKKSSLRLMAVFVASALASFPGCKPKETEEEAGSGAPEKKEKPGAAEERTQTKLVLTCGMAGHPEFAPGKEPADGKCPQCGMKLVRKEIPAAQAAEAYWTCPMHPEVREKAPGNCPKCGMKLVQKEIPTPKTD